MNSDVICNLVSESNCCFIVFRNLLKEDCVNDIIIDVFKEGQIEDAVCYHRLFPGEGKKHYIGETSSFVGKIKFVIQYTKGSDPTRYRHEDFIKFNPKLKYEVRQDSTIKLTESINDLRKTINDGRLLRHRNHILTSIISKLMWEEPLTPQELIIAEDIKKGREIKKNDIKGLL